MTSLLYYCCRSARLPEVGPVFLEKPQWEGGLEEGGLGEAVRLDLLDYLVQLSGGEGKGDMRGDQVEELEGDGMRYIAVFLQDEVRIKYAAKCWPYTYMYIVAGLSWPGSHLLILLIVRHTISCERCCG